MVILNDSLSKNTQSMCCIALILGGYLKKDQFLNFLMMAVPQVDYEFERIFNRRLPKFGIAGTEYRLKVADIPPGLHYLLVADIVHNVLERVLLELLYMDDGTARYPQHHRVRLSLMSAGLDHEIWIPFVSPREMTVDRVMVSVEKVLQSKKEWLFSGPMTVMFVHAPLPP